MTPEYLAGFIDADGSFGIYRHNELSIQIAQINKEVLDQIQAKYGGRVIRVKARHYKKGFIHQYYLNRRDHVKTMILDILPHLIVKKAEAKIVLTFIGTYTTPYGRDRGTGQTAKKQLRHDLAAQLKQLKQ